MFSEGIGIVVKAIASDVNKSQKLMKNMIRWYVVDSLLSDLSIMYIIKHEDTADKLPVRLAVKLAFPVK